MNYPQSYDYLISLNNLPRREYMADPRHCGWYLKRLQFFLDILNNPEKKIPHYIHVTGTSGKGSVCLMLNSILNKAGKKTGILTSPHPSIIIERWGINNQPMPKTDFAKIITKLKPLFDEYIRTSPYDMLSYGEMSTAIALYYFAQQKVDWAVLEVGCGGRYDSTNVIPRKDVAVITNIGLDHKGTIGDTREAIAIEKSGIIKPNCQVFTSEKSKKILEIINKEARKNKVKVNKCNAKIKINKQTLQGIEFIYNKEKYSLPVLGEHQAKNAVLVIDLAKSLKIPEEIIKTGLSSVKIPICMEVINQKPLIILDGAHNDKKIESSLQTIKQISGKNKVHLVVGFAHNKEWGKLIKQLAKLKPVTISCTRFSNNIFRKVASPKEVADKFKKLLPKTKVNIFLDAREALEWSKQQAKQNETILVTGSIFLSGEIREQF